MECAKEKKLLKVYFPFLRFEYFCLVNQSKTLFNYLRRSLPLNESNKCDKTFISSTKLFDVQNTYKGINHCLVLISTSLSQKIHFIIVKIIPYIYGWFHENFLFFNENFFFEWNGKFLKNKRRITVLFLLVKC